MVWEDFMGRVLQEGDDIIVAVDDELHTGVVHSITDEKLKYSYNHFVGDREYVEDESVESCPDWEYATLHGVFVLNRK